MSQEFLPKDPAKAVFEIKETLYIRLTRLRYDLAEYDTDQFASISDAACQLEAEINFLEYLLDICERS